MTKVTDVSIEVRPRIHLGLISMHSGAVRKHGGIGFSVANPTAMVEMHRADQFNISDNRTHPFTKAEIDQIAAALGRPIASNHLPLSAEVTISGNFQTHIGMGSGTAIRLAITEGLYLLNGITPSKHELINRSGRGGTSGVGVYTYFSGCMILDLGIPNDGSPFTPSSLLNAEKIPTALPALAMPEWPLCLCIPRAVTPKTQEEEIQFFARTAPLSPHSSYYAAYEALFNVYASVAEGDYSAFCRAVNAMQETEWKACEWRAYDDRLINIRQKLTDLGADCVGMSSLGPMLFCFGSISTLEKIDRCKTTLDCEVIRTIPHNEGRRTVSQSLRCSI